MNCSILRSSAIFIFALISNEVCGFIFPTCFQSDLCSKRKIENDSLEKTSDRGIIDILKCVLCMTVSYAKSVFNNFVKRTNLIFAPAKTYIYKPPPSLFEKLAIWTGAMKEDNSDDELWVSQKLFMLASSIIFSMLFLYYGQNWMSKLLNITKLGKYRIFVHRKEFMMSRVSSSLSLATCKSELDENI